MIDTAPEETLVLGLESRIYAARLIEPAEPPKGGTPNGGSVKQRPDRSKRGQFWLLAFPRFQAPRPYRSNTASAQSAASKRFPSPASVTAGGLSRRAGGRSATSQSVFENSGEPPREGTRPTKIGRETHRGRPGALTGRVLRPALSREWLNL